MAAQPPLLAAMSDIPKGHMGSAGVVPVQLNARYVWLLHLYAEQDSLLVQDAAAQIVEEFLDTYAARRCK